MQHKLQMPQTLGAPVALGPVAAALVLDVAVALVLAVAVALVLAVAVAVAVTLVLAVAGQRGDKLVRTPVHRPVP